MTKHEKEIKELRDENVRLMSIAGINLSKIIESTDYAIKYFDLKARADNLAKCLEYFIDRVDNGTIKSKTTYDKFVKALDKYKRRK